MRLVTLRLRSYQQELVDGSLALWGEGYRRIAMVMATGGGKTPTAMSIAELSLAGGHPVLWLAHRTELIDQAIDKARQVAPGRVVGRMQGRDKQYRAELVVGSIQTCSTPSSLRLLRERSWGLIVVDETHHVTADTYMRLLRELHAFNEDGGPLVLGVTATLDRSDGAALGQVFQAVVEPRIGLVDLIKHPEGPFLVPPRGVRVRIAGLNLDKVKRVAGDFSGAALGRAMTEALAPQKIIEAWEEHAKGVPTMAFLPTVAISIEQAQAFNDAGHVAVHLDGTTPDDVRAKALDDFRNGDVTIICNVGLFTEGTDLPSIGCILMGRPTSSGNLYRQIIGRGLRLYPGKKFCWVIDFVGATERHNLANLVSLDGADNEEELPDDLLMYEQDDEADDADQDEAEDEPAPIDYATGDLAHEFVDLFGASHTSWLRTRGGRWFTAAGTAGFLFLRAGTEGHFDLCGITPAGEVFELRTGMEIGYAMAAGDELVAQNPIWQGERDAPWRRQRAYGSVRTKGELWDDKMILRASDLLD